LFGGLSHGLTGILRFEDQKSILKGIPLSAATSTHRLNFSSTSTIHSAAAGSELESIPANRAIVL
jgi:hypothetical protein